MIEYKGARITPALYSGYEWIHDDYFDADWTGDGWQSYGCGYGKTVEDCKEYIDDFFEQLDITKH
jgi:hypothetical protein